MNRNMNTDHHMIPEHYYLQPGYILVPERSMSISTVIGSGVCVCIYDKKKKIGGMNHFQFPFMDQKGKTTPIYGNAATIGLIRMILSTDTQKRFLDAQIFGGAHNPGISDRNIGKENIDIARKTLARSGITVTSEDIGGEKGRKIVFNTHSNEIAVLKVDNLRTADWYPYE